MTESLIPNQPPQAIDEKTTKDRVQWREILREGVETLLLAAVIFLLVNFLTMRCEVDGPSMQPTLETGQRLIVYRLAYVFGGPQRGDVVVFRSPNNPSDNLVKRIIGLPGETVSVRDGRIYIDDILLEEPDFIPESQYGGTWEIPEGHYFALGDNRNASNDSHSWGAVSAEDIIGRAWASYWPPEKWSAVQHYRGYHIDVDDT